MYSRPKPGETEDDLLRLQEEFEKQKTENKITPAAQVVGNKSKDQHKTGENPVDISKADVEEQLANTFEAIPSNINLKNIIEKQNENNISVMKFNKSTGFPKAKRRDPNMKSGNGSIFSQQIKKLKTEETPMEIDINTRLKEDALIVRENIELYTCSKNTTNDNKNLPSQSFILSGSDSKQIHEENLDLIKQMTETEIIEEREKLIATMDPAIVAFLKSRRKKNMPENRNPTIKEQNVAASDVVVEEIETTSELLAQPRAEKWLNFDVIETNKLAWMKNVDIPKIKTSEKYEARFDFEGWLLPYSEPEINEQNRILYHHGEEPGRPGYTLQELFQLSRSSIIQQKILALNTVANILSLHSTGVYDEILDLPIEQIFFVVRFCLDDNTPAVLNASIKAMRNLIFSQVDETCLDSLLGFGLGLVQPLLITDNEMEDDYTVNDQQLVEKNLIKCVARTEILTRIRYIINSVKPPLDTIVYCMDILIRLARDNDFMVTKIFNSVGLIDCIIKHFVPVTLSLSSSSPYGLPLLQAVKFIRVLSARSKNIAVKLLNKYKTLDSLIVYLSNDTFSANVNGMRLQTECMHYWSLLIHYGFGLDYFGVLQPILISLLDYHFKNTDLVPTTTFVRHGHISALLILLGNTVVHNYTLILPFLPLVLEQCLPKWTSQFCMLKEYSCGKLQLISSLIYCISKIRLYQKNDMLDGTVIKIITSVGFGVATDTILSGSMLINNYETHKSSSNLKTLEAAVWHTMDHVVPIIQTNSCIPFLYAITEYLKISENRKVQLNFLNHPNVKKYVTSLQKLEKYYLTNNWFAQPESFILMNILKSSVSVKDDLDTSVYYELAVKCLGIFNSLQKPDIEFLFSNIVFCSKFYPSEVLMQHLDIDQRNANLEVSLSNLGEIFTVYTQVLGLKNNVPDLSTSCSIDISVGNVIPIDWIYTPILVLYSNQLQNKCTADEEHQIFTVRNCLRWVLIYETYFPFLASGINCTDKFCRLACVFLGSDNLFLTKEIQDLLHLCFQTIITKFEDQLNFNKKIEGLSNFQDFYTQLLEQYQSVSYGNVLFGNVILVPLAQNHNVQFRKTLWSEYMGVVQVFNVASNQMISNLQLFLEPPEKDKSLLTCYRRAILNNTVRKHSVLYKIANHHVEHFIKNKQEKN